jgi:hypothetical protein
VTRRWALSSLLFPLAILSLSGCTDSPEVQTTVMYLATCPQLPLVEFHVQISDGSHLASAALNTTVLPRWQFQRYETTLGNHSYLITESTTNLSRHVNAELSLESSVLNVQLLCDPEPRLQVFVHESAWTSPAPSNQVEMLG